MNAAHTPGPWHVVTIDGSIGSIEAEDGSPVAQAQPRGTSRHLDHAERRANADFIVHSANCHDDLVRALGQAFTALTSVTVKTRGEGEILQSAARSVADALSKAKGGQGE